MSSTTTETTDALQRGLEWLAKERRNTRYAIGITRTIPVLSQNGRNTLQFVGSFSNARARRLNRHRGRAHFWCGK